MPNRQLQIQTQPGLWPFSWPIGLTLLRLLLLPVFLWLLLAQHGHLSRAYRWGAVGIFGIMAITDKLDGFLARRWNQTSKIGALLDPIADKLLIACSVLLLSFDWLAPAGFAIPKPVFLAVYGKDLIVALGAIGLLYAVGRVTITPRFLGKASTFLQLTMILLTLLAPDVEHFSRRWTAVSIKVLWWTVTAAVAAACVDYLVVGWRQLAEHRRQRVAITGK
jgi:CDP-diacylglycerol--glycerol-3-phosphate 3-phosphatidyltransferase